MTNGAAIEGEDVVAPHAVVFDLDGTIADSQDGVLLSLHETLEHFGRAESDDQLRALIGPPLGESFRLLGFADDQLGEVMEYYRDIYDRVGVARAHPYDGVLDVLNALRDRGVILAVATSKRVDFAERMLSDFAIRDLFVTVAGASLDGTRTSKVDIVTEAREAFDVAPSRTWMVGDRHHDIDAARELGLVPIGVLWGYGSREELHAAGARWLVAQPAELLGLLRADAGELVSGPDA